MKPCSICKVTKAIDLFPRDRRNKDGYAYRCKACDSDVRAAWVEKNRAANTDRASNWYRENRDRHSYRANQYAKRRYATCPEIRIKMLLRGRVRDYLAGKNKAAKSVELLGCTLSEYRAHLEAQFHPGMSWDNHGEWHIDHIRPLASFDMTDPKQQFAAFNFKNTQPLWARDNLQKSSRMAA